MLDAPATIDDKQLKELSIAVINTGADKAEK
jgi:hypothetical protein